MSIDKILEQRQHTHGDFNTHANITQKLKTVIYSEIDRDNYTNSMLEALDMILHKVGRIVSGNPRHIDHWDDIAGYATLVSRELHELDEIKVACVSIEGDKKC